MTNKLECTALLFKTKEKGEVKEKYFCKNPATYSEQGHRLAGKYCDNHGMAVHALRRGRPCNCGQCASAVRRIGRQKKAVGE